MTRSIWTKWIIGAAILLLIIAAGCFLWYQHTTAPYKAEADKDDKLLKQWEADKAKPTTTAEKVSTKIPIESRTSTAEKPITKEAVVNTETETKQVQTVVPVQIAAAKVRVSKFGFGPYPELPADFPWQDLFDPPYYSEDPVHPYKDVLEYELMDRIWVELWKRGEYVEGMGTLESTGLFYPTIRGTIYVEWAPRWKVFGKGFGRKIRYIDGHPDDIDRLEGVKRHNEIPSDLKVLDISEGIDAYEFLNLSK